MPYSDSDSQKKAQRKHYLANKDAYLARNRARHKELQRQVRELYTACEDCGYFHEAAMDWHHVDPSTKEYTVSRMIRRKMSFARIKAEIEKCVCLCSNCHRIRHA